MSRAGDIAYKLCGGFKLTIREFEIALEKGMLSGSKPNSQEELARDYLWWVASYYEDSGHRGYLCNSHPTKVIKDDGSGHKTLCMWGIHLDQVKPEALTNENLKFLRHCFGKEKVKEITGR